MNDNQNIFIGEKIKEMISDGVSVNFVYRVNKSKNDMNYFACDELYQKPEFTMNVFDRLFHFDIFIHEYCHYEQWKEFGKRKWNNVIKNHQLFWDWRECVVSKISKKNVRVIQQLELDADRRVLQYNNQLGLGIDEDNYCRETNAYILVYDYLYKRGIEGSYYAFPENFAIEDIKELLPNRLLTKEELNGNWKHIYKLFDKFQ